MEAVKLMHMDLMAAYLAMAAHLAVTAEHLAITAEHLAVVTFAAAITLVATTTFVVEQAAASEVAAQVIEVEVAAQMGPTCPCRELLVSFNNYSCIYIL